MPPVFYFINPCFYILTTYCSPLHSFDPLACDPGRHTFPRITVFLSHDCTIYDVLQLDMDCNTQCSRTIMSNIRFYEIRRISLNKGNLVHRLGTRRSRIALILQRFGSNDSNACMPPASSDIYARQGRTRFVQATRHYQCPISMTPSMEVGPLNGF